MIITIDGPSGTGKTTIAKLIAKRLDFEYFDTGAMYRSITHFFMRRNVDVTNLKEVEKNLSGFLFSVQMRGLEKHYFVDQEDVTRQIRSQEVTSRVSKVAAIRPVRELVWKMQRASAAGKDAVFEGRDMGTVVFPGAEVKIFLTATPEIRAERRLKEFEGKEEFEGLDHAQMLKELLRRDEHDSTRELAPLRQAADAHLVDTSELSVEEVVEAILQIVEKQRQKNR